jgi:hypothetical protein
MLILYNDNLLIGKNDSSIMPIQNSSVKHPKKMLKVKHYLGLKNLIYLEFFCQIYVFAARIVHV